MEILLDSDVIIAWLRGYDPYTRLIPELLDNGNVLAWTPVSMAEIFAGARRSEEKHIESLFLIFEALHITPEVGRRAGKYLNLYRKSHGMDLGDALIAATVHVSGFALWTLNKKHYPVREISIYSPQD